MRCKNSVTNLLGSNYKNGRNLLWWKEVHDYIPVNWKCGQVITPEKRRVGPLAFVFGCPSSLRLPPSCLGTSKQGSCWGGEGGTRAQLTPPSSLLLYRIVVGCRFSGFLIANSHQSKLHTNSNDIWQIINKGKCATPLEGSTWLQLWNSSRFIIIIIIIFFFFFFFFLLLTYLIHSFIHSCHGLVSWAYGLLLWLVVFH